MVMLSIVLPFSGFYASAHDAELDSALESCFQDESGEPYPGFVSRAFDAIEWGSVQEGYAREYCAAFADYFGIVGLEFEELNSPREYNFTTDRIFAKIPADEMARILRECPADTLASVAREWFTSRSGFISFYSPDVDEWGELDEWDHNQRGALLSAWVEWKHGDSFEGWEQVSILESWRCNGGADALIWDNIREPMRARLGRAYDYLRARENRRYRHDAGRA